MGGADEQECMEEVAAPRERERERERGKTKKNIIIIYHNMSV